jgi:PTS system nitrogen regulatory IIA component
MIIDDILAPDDVLVGLRAANKRALLDTLARRAADSLGLFPEDVLSALLRREELGSTGVGEGVALPHARLDAIRHPHGVLARLREPIDFGAVDDRPVDLVFLLLQPAASSADPLNALASIARRLRDRDAAAAMRKARDAAALHALMREDPP